jgi:hypothetical protein
MTVISVILMLGRNLLASFMVVRAQ